MSEDPYPVIEERPLAAVARRFFRTTRRDLADLPEARPGTLWVFDVGGHYEALDRRRLSGTEPVVLDAVAVSLVDIRPRRVPVELSIPSSSPADDFVFRADFRCRVTNPSMVVAAGLTDVTVPLHSYLKKDQILPVLGTGFTVDDITTFREEITARVFSYCEGDPPRIEGMEVALDAIAVRTPADLRTQETKMRDERWDQKLRSLQRTGEQTDVTRLTALLADPQRALALAVSLGDITAGQAADQEFSELDKRLNKSYEIIKFLQENGHLDRVPLDAKLLVDWHFEAITGSPQGYLAITGGDGSGGAVFMPDEDDPAE